MSYLKNLGGPVFWSTLYTLIVTVLPGCTQFRIQVQNIVTMFYVISVGLFHAKSSHIGNSCVKAGGIGRV